MSKSQTTDEERQQWLATIHHRIRVADISACALMLSCQRLTGCAETAVTCDTRPCDCAMLHEQFMRRAEVVA